MRVVCVCLSMGGWRNGRRSRENNARVAYSLGLLGGPRPGAFRVTYLNDRFTRHARCSIPIYRVACTAGSRDRKDGRSDFEWDEWMEIKKKRFRKNADGTAIFTDVSRAAIV